MTSGFYLECLRLTPPSWPLFNHEAVYSKQMAGPERIMQIVRWRRSAGLRRAVLVIVAIVVLVLVLFPDWYAIHPTDPTLNMLIGHAWIGSPPSPPKGFEAMTVQKGNGWIIFSVVAVLLGAFVYWGIGLSEDRK